MKRCWRISWLGLFFAILIGLTVWDGVDWLLKPKPQHIVVKDYFHSILNSGFNQKELHDSTGWWIARANPMAPLQVVGEWTAFDLKTGAARKLIWVTDYDKPTVPIPNGYRHVRTAPDGTLEIVDTLFTDGSSTVRLHLPPGTRIAPYMLFNHDGSRAVTLQRFPHSLLRVLGNLNGPAWDALAVAHLQNQVDKSWFPFISCDAVIARAWEINSGKCTREFLLPPLTTVHGLQLSPNGRWLGRPETGLLPEKWFILRPDGSITLPTKAGEHYLAAEPRGVFAFDLENGRTLRMPVNEESKKEAVFFVHVGDTGLSFVPIMMMPNSATGISVYVPLLTPVTDDFVPLHRFPDGKKTPWQKTLASVSNTELSPIRTVEGHDISVVQTEYHQGVAIVSLDDDGIHVRSDPVELNTIETVHIQPTNQPGQVLATWKTEGWPYRYLDLAWRLRIDLNKYFPRNPSLSFALVDVHQAKILLEDHISYDPKESTPEYKLTHDRSAILLTELKDRDLHITRWDLPISIWSPWWGRGAGLISVMFILLLLRKRRGTPDAQNSANLFATSPLSSPDRFACGQAVN